MSESIQYRDERTLPNFRVAKSSTIESRHPSRRSNVALPDLPVRDPARWRRPDDQLDRSLWIVRILTRVAGLGRIKADWSQGGDEVTNW